MVRCLCIIVARGERHDHEDEVVCGDTAWRLSRLLNGSAVGAAVQAPRGVERERARLPWSAAGVFVLGQEVDLAVWVEGDGDGNGANGRVGDARLSPATDLAEARVDVRRVELRRRAAVNDLHLDERAPRGDEAREQRRALDQRTDLVEEDTLAQQRRPARASVEHAKRAPAAVLLATLRWQRVGGTDVVEEGGELYDERVVEGERVDGRLRRRARGAERGCDLPRRAGRVCQLR